MGREAESLENKTQSRFVRLFAAEILLKPTAMMRVGLISSLVEILGYQISWRTRPHSDITLKCPDTDQDENARRMNYRCVLRSR